MKICKECKWVGNPDLVSGWAIVRCLNPEYSPPGDRSPVTGVAANAPPVLAETCRTRENACGPDAKGFEPRGTPFRLRNPIKRVIWSVACRTWVRWLAG